MVIFMHDHKGNIWKEEKYQGYGIFGGKDYYELLAEMNGKQTRDEGIEIEYSDKKTYIFPVLTYNEDWSKEYGQKHDFTQKMKNDPYQGEHSAHLQKVWDKHFDFVKNLILIPS